MCTELKQTMKYGIWSDGILKYQTNDREDLHKTRDTIRVCDFTAGTYHTLRIGQLCKGDVRFD
jgi:hypothetical protein